MDDKILEILLDMQKELKDVKKELTEVKIELKEVNKKIDKVEYKMNDGFETLELLCENNSNDINRLKIKVSKVENRLKEMNKLN